MHQPAARSLENNRARGEAGAARHYNTSCAAVAAEQRTRAYGRQHRALTLLRFRCTVEKRATMIT
jgi:hypothetical protein